MPNYQNKTKDELINELKELHEECVSIKASYEKDIIVHKRSEEERRDSEEKWRKLVTTIPDYIALHDLDGRYLFLNHYAVGFSEKDVIGKTLYDFISEDSKEEYRLNFNKCIQTKQTQRFIYSAFGNEMAFRYYETYLVPLIEKKKIVSIMAIAMDITDRKQGEDALHLEKDNFRHSLDDSPLGVRIATIEGNTIYANKTLLDYYGYASLNELQKTPLKNRYTPESYIQAQNRKRHRKHNDFSISDYEVSIVRKNGKIRHLRVFRKEVLWDGVRQFQVIYNDITENKLAEDALRESEARFRSLFENSIIGISTASTDGRLLQANPAYARMYGFKSPEIMLAEVTNVGKLYAKPEDRKEIIQILSRNGFMEAKEVEVVRRDGSRFFVLVSACEIRDAEGKLLYNQATHIDLTERRKMEAELQNSKELLEKLNHRLNEIRENERAAISREIHDEVGQSMTALKLDLNRMYKYVNSDADAVKQLDGMVVLVSDTIKEVQRISSDLRPGILDDLGLAAAIEWYSEEFEKRTGIGCRISLDDSIQGDPQKDLVFFRVLQEALTNVIRHSDASSVSIKLYKSESGITMSIHDNGKGMLPEIAESVKSLGLIGMRERVRQLGGKIDISSKKGQGTKLTILIPFK
jgi:PAS domain S-box-containing protein